MEKHTTRSNWCRRIKLGVIAALAAAVSMSSRADDDITSVDLGTNRAPAQIFYIPMPEDDLLTALKAINNTAVDPMQTYVSLAVFVDGTVIYYDQWENGYERDIANPNNIYSASNKGGTQIWGDGNPDNGCAPGTPDDLLLAGDVIILQNAVNSKTRKTVIDWDAGDKIGATKPIAVTRAGWASASNTLLAFANEVFDTVFFGTEFVNPVGPSLANSYQMFEYCSFSIMASENGTLVQVDTDNDGVFEFTKTINEGETAYVAGLQLGAKIKTSKPVQVDLFTGDVGSSYESRSFRILPTSMWTDAVTAPVATSSSYGTRVWIYNPDASPLSVTAYSRASTSAAITTSNITVQANGCSSVTLKQNCAMRFVSASGRKFYAVSTIDSTSSSKTGSGASENYTANQTYDWGYALVPDAALTTQLLVGMGIGRDFTSSTNPRENASPVWITTIGNGDTPATVYVDYDGDPFTPITGFKLDPNGNKYDISYSLKELVTQAIYNPGGDQTGMLVYTLDENVKLAAAWGEDPAKATAGSPGLDFGTGIPPLPVFFMQKDSRLLADSDGDGYITPEDTIRYSIKIENVGRQPIADIYVKDELPSVITYKPGTTKLLWNSDQDTVVETSIPDLTGGTFPLSKAAPGYYLYDITKTFPVGKTFLPVGGTWYVEYDAVVNPFDSNSGVAGITNLASVISGNTAYTNRVVDPLRGRIGDYAWVDANMDGRQDATEEGLNGVLVRLLHADGTPVLDDFDNPYEVVTRSNTTTHANGYYVFTGVRPGDYMVEFLPPEGYGFSQRGTGATEDVINDSDVGTVASPDAGFRLNTTKVFTLQGGQFEYDIDAGFIKLGKISGSVFVDQNADGIIDGVDTDPIFGVTIELLTNGVVYMTTTTKEDGSYEFNGLPPGDYTIRELDPPGYISTTDKDGENDNLITVTLPFGGESIENDFYDATLGSIGDRVWDDANNNGLQDVGEAGVPGVAVELYTNGVLVASTTTDTNGRYIFANLYPGTYKVKFIVPDGKSFTRPDVGGAANDALDSDADPDNGMTGNIIITSGKSDLTVDAGLCVNTGEDLAPAISVVKLAGDASGAGDPVYAPDGTVLALNKPSGLVTYSYLVTNVGETYLKNVTVSDDILGIIGTIPLLATNASVTLYKATTITESVTNVATVSGHPVQENGDEWPVVKPDVTASDDAVVIIVPNFPAHDQTVCELLDFGKNFNAVIFGNLSATGGIFGGSYAIGDTEGNLLVWGDAHLAPGYSVGLEAVGEPMPKANTYDDALIVGGDLFIGYQDVNGNIVYGGAYTGVDRKYMPYSLRNVSPVTVGPDGNVPNDGSGMTMAQMKTKVLQLSTMLAGWADKGVVSVTKGGEGDLANKIVLTGDDPDRNIFNIHDYEWSDDVTTESRTVYDRILDVPPTSTVIINVSGYQIDIGPSRMVLPVGMNPNQVLIHYTQATVLDVEGFDHEGSILAPNLLKGGMVPGARFVGAAVQGIAILGGDVVTELGAEFHNFPMRVFHCPTNPVIRLVVTANGARDGEVLTFTNGATATITVRHTVMNNGASWLRGITLTTVAGIVQLGDLPPGGVAIYDVEISDVTADATFAASVVSTPTEVDGQPVPKFPYVFADDIAVVKFVAADDAAAPLNPYDDPTQIGQPGYKADLEITNMWFTSQPTITGEVFTVNVLVQNSGLRTSIGGKLNFYCVLITNATTQATITDVTPEELVGSYDLGVFLAGEESVGEMRTFSLTHDAQALPGQYRIVAIIDNEGLFEELSTGNNHDSLQYQLSATTVAISVDSTGVTLTWNNDWDQTYSIMYSTNLVTWLPLPGFSGDNSIESERRDGTGDTGSEYNSVTLPFIVLPGDDVSVTDGEGNVIWLSDIMKASGIFFKLRIDQI